MSFVSHQVGVVSPKVTCIEEAESKATLDVFSPIKTKAKTCIRSVPTTCFRSSIAFSTADAGDGNFFVSPCTWAPCCALTGKIGSPFHHLWSRCFGADGNLILIFCVILLIVYIMFAGRELCDTAFARIISGWDLYCVPHAHNLITPIVGPTR